MREEKLKFYDFSMEKLIELSDLRITIKGYLLHTTLSNKELKALGIKTNSPKDFYGYY